MIFGLINCQLHYHQTTSQIPTEYYDPFSRHQEEEEDEDRDYTCSYQLKEFTHKISHRDISVSLIVPCRVYWYIYNAQLQHISKKCSNARSSNAKDMCVIEAKQFAKPLMYMPVRSVRLLVTVANNISSWIGTEGVSAIISCVRFQDDGAWLQRRN